MRPSGSCAVLGLLQPHRLGLDPDQELVAELLLELVRDPLEVLAAVGVEQVTGLGVVAVAVHAGDPLVPGEHGERVEVGHRRELGLLGPKPDVVAMAVGEQVRGGAVDELVALLRDLREERRHDALAHHAAGDRHLLEEHVLDALLLDPARDLLDLLASSGSVPSLLERRRRRRDPRAFEHGLYGSTKRHRHRTRVAAVDCYRHPSTPFFAPRHRAMRHTLPNGRRHAPATVVQIRTSAFIPVAGGRGKRRPAAAPGCQPR